MQRLGYLDSLRGLAILGVLLVHCSATASLGDARFDGLLAYGARGVQLFYMVSAYTLLHVAKQPLDIGRFWLRRFFRIAPAFYLALITYLVLDGLGPRYYAPAGISSHQILLSFLFLHGMAPDAVNAIIPGGWSIACEMMFYAMFPLLFRVVTSLRRACIAFAISGVVSITALKLLPLIPSSFPGIMPDFAFFSVLAQLPVFLAGFVVFHLPRMRTPVLAKIGAGLSLLILLLLALAGPRAAHFLLSIPPLALLLWSMASAPVPTLNNRVIRWLGAISFSLYLTHHLVLDRLARLIPGQGITRFIMVFLATLVLSCVVAWLSYRIVERKGIALGRRLFSDALPAPVQVQAPIW